MLDVIYTAAHAVDHSEQIPLGGGAAISRMLTTAWHAAAPFQLRVIGPSILGDNAPSGRDLIRFGESQYAKFCRDFERATTTEILRHDPSTTIILANDISEGPDFAALAKAGFAIATIYHVDVVAYVTAMYLKGLVRPETTVRWYDRLERFGIPDTLKLVWDKQRASARHSRLLVVPSSEMKAVLERCYPHDTANKIFVLPWGVSQIPAPTPDEIESLRCEYAMPADAFTILTLSRISPEKGQDLLLDALAAWKPPQQTYVFICGGAAYMYGQRHLDSLKRKAAALINVTVIFPGHVTDRRKAAFFGLADGYVFPSVHESYGLTLVEALAAGLPAVCVGHAGAMQVMRPEFGEVVPAGSRNDIINGLRLAIDKLALQPELRHKMGRAARVWASTQTFSNAAETLSGRLLALL